jgi:aspartyl protease family protein
VRLQDRDYYWHKQKASKSHAGDFDALFSRSRYRHQKPAKKNSGSLRYLLAPALMLIGLWQGAERILTYKTAQRPLKPAAAQPISAFEPEIPKPISGGLIIKADRQGHFRGTALINDVPMPFMIDTGATVTSIPENLAFAARLPVGAMIDTNTAGGRVIGRLTKINSLKIGNAEINHLDACINGHLDEVLIGMNTLKYFDITQSGNTMTLVANGSTPQQIAGIPVSAYPPDQPRIKAAEQAAPRADIKRRTVIKKSVSCDANHVCTTRYSDH